MTKAVSDREICFIKTVLLLCEHGQKLKMMKGEGEGVEVDLCLKNPLPLFIDM